MKLGVPLITFASVILAVHSVAEPLSLEDMGARVLVITAHPDDAEMYCGGTIHALTALGTHVSLLITTTGDAGGSCGNETGACTREKLAYLRANEALAGAAILGLAAEDVAQLGFHDGSVTSASSRDAIVEGIAAHARGFQPTSVVTFFQGPDWDAPPMRGLWPYAWDDLGFHPDHQGNMQGDA